jgi:hypothetical protein
LQIDNTTSPTIEQAAAFKVDRAFADPACECIHLFVVPDKPGDPLPPDVSAARVAFTRAQRAEAIVWTVAVLKAHWIMFRAEH